MFLNNPVYIHEKAIGIDVTLADSLSIGLFFTDLNGKCLYANNKWLEITGLTLDGALGDGWVNAVHPEDRDRVISEWKELHDNEQKFDSEYRFQRNDKSIIWVLGQANKYNDQDDNISGYVGTITNITERKNTEASLHQLAEGFSIASSSEFFRSFSMHLSKLLDVDFVVGELNDDTSNSVKSVVVNNRGNILDPIEYTLIGTPCETVIGKSVKGYRCDIQKKFPKFELLKALGTEGYVGTPLFDSSNNSIGIIAVLDSKPIDNIHSVEDVLQIYATRASAELERKQKEEEIKRVNKELEFKQFTIEHISESIFWTDINAKIHDINDAACQSLGYTRNELLQLSIPDIDPSVTYKGWRKHWIETKSGNGKKDIESIHKTKEGKMISVDIHINHFEFGGMEYHCSIVRDIRAPPKITFRAYNLRTRIFLINLKMKITKYRS